MKKLTRSLALVLALVMMFCLLAGTLASCKDNTEGPNDNGGNDNGGNNNNNNGNGGSNGKINYTVNIKNSGGRPMEGVTVTVWSDSEFQDMENYGVTDSNGSVVLSMAPKDSYYAKLSGLPEGYVFDDSYTFTGTTSNITVTSKIIANTSLSGVVYSLGSIMRDFTVTTNKGETVTLSEILKEKDAVLLNFWYIGCQWCVEEFPYMEAAYKNYSEDVAIVALNPYSSDTMEDIKAFANTSGLTFDMAQDVGAALATSFGVTSYPTSVMIDKYGSVCLIVKGAITGEKYFNTIFDHFTAANYEQKLLVNYEDLAPAEKPSIEMPDSATLGGVFNSGDINASYYPDDDEYAWPFIVGELNGEQCIKSTNAGKDASYSILYADVALKAGEALAFDYFTSTEYGADILYIFVDGVDINAISGVSTDWKTCYPFVALEDGTYKVSFSYLKDSETDTEDDTVYLKDFRVVSADDIDVATYIPRMCATKPFANGDGYQSYASVVLGDDGYYHVGTKDGPLLLADLMYTTPFSSKISVYSYLEDAKLKNTAFAAHYDKLVKYCNYAVNSNIYGLCTVDQTLREYLELFVLDAGSEFDNPNQWLQVCLYYDAYGEGTPELADPIAGLAPHSAFPTVINPTVGENEYPNSVTYDKVLMPRGLWYELTPTVSGVYRIVSNLSEKDRENTFLEGWIFLGDESTYHIYERCERILENDANVYIYVYLEAGTTYYIDIAYNDMYYAGTFGFKIEYLGEEYDYYRAVSPGAAFTTEVDENGNMTSTKIAGGVKVVLNEEDGYYYNVLADGTMGTSRIYADFTMFTSIFGKKCLEDLIKEGAFDFTKSEEDHIAIYYYENFTDAELREEWGVSYEEYYDHYQMNDIKHGIYHGKGNDLTALAQSYCDQMIVGNEDINVNGCVEVNEELADLLQQLMDKYTFENVENSWVKLCYFFDHLDSDWEWIPFA